MIVVPSLPYRARRVQEDPILSQEGPKSALRLDVETRYVFGAYI